MNIVYQVRRSSLAILVLACGAQLMVVLDGLIVNVALPRMSSGLGLSGPGQQWVVDGYLVTFGGLLLFAARAADLVGHRRVFLSGVTVFTLASLAGGLATDGTVLVAARVVQGIGAAALAPSSLSLLTTAYTGDQRARALSIWSATSGSAGALGLVLGGVLTGTLGWRWVLLVNVPVGVALWVLASSTLPASRPLDRSGVDLPGAVAVTAGVGCLTYAISRAHSSGWISPGVVVTLAATAVALIVFVLVERASPAPLVPLGVLRRHPLALANTMMALLGAVMTATLYFLSLYLQRALGESPLRTGLALVPMSVVITVGAIASKSLLPRFGAKRLLTTGAVVMAVGLLWLATIPARSDYPVHVLGPTLVWAAGASIATMPCVALATGGVGSELAGLASGLVNTARQVGAAVGLAGLVAVASASAGHGADRADTVHGYGVAFAVAAAIALLIAVLAQRVRTPVRV